MPEYPTAIWDKEYDTDVHPSGGLDGLAEWLKIRKETQPYDLFLMTANDLPRIAAAHVRADHFAGFLDRVERRDVFP